ncbi:MAG: hypothetical protein J0M24_17525 [Verrucomicrobia bacterium]|nr:hypothetical protein [Verrucomicrobiota bacterium]
MNSEPSPAGTDPGAEAEGQPCRWRRFGGGCWRGFRWCTRAGYVVLALFAYALFHLHQIGLPGFLKDRVVAQLAAQGLKLDYSRLRLEFGHGLVAENVTLHFRNAPASQFVFFKQIQLKFGWSALWSDDQTLIRALGLVGGEAGVPVEGGAGAPATLMKFTDLSGDLEFLGPDDWRLVGLTAKLNNLEFEAMGTVKNVAWLYTGSTSGSGGSFEVKSRPLARVMEGLEQMEFREPPRVELNFAVDGRSLAQSVVQFRFGTAGARSPQGDFEQVRLSVNLQPDPREKQWLRGAIRLQASEVRTRWGAFDSLLWKADVRLPPTNQPPTFLDWRLTAQSLRSEELQLGSIRAHGTTLATNAVAPIPPGLGVRSVARAELSLVEGFFTQLEVTARDFRSPWAVATNATLDARLWSRTNEWVPAAADWAFTSGATRVPQFRLDGLSLQGSALPVAAANQMALTQFWTNLAPWRFQLQSRATNVVISSGQTFERAGVSVDWKGGRLAVSNLLLRVPEGGVSLSGNLDVPSRSAVVAVEGELSLRAMDGLLPPAWWGQVTNQGVRPENRLKLDLSARGDLPPWDTPSTNWVSALRRSIAVEGGLRATNLAWDEVVIDGVEARFGAASDRVSLDSFRVEERGGELNARGELDLGEGRFRAQLDSSIDLLAFRPLIKGPGLGRQLDLITLGIPPAITAEAWGNFKHPDEVGFRASVAITNATYRLEPVTELRTTLGYTNQAVTFMGTELRMGTNSGRASYMRYDAKTQLLELTNAVAQLDLAALGRAIGPKTAQVLAPYYFPQPPLVQATGFIPITPEAQANVVFQARAPQFEWWYFRFTNLLATVAWKGTDLIITNVASGFYGGVMSANVKVNVKEPKNTTFQAETTFADVQVNLLMEDLVTRTNQLGGILSGQVIIDQGQGKKGLPWKGSGNAQIRDGVLWGLPLFGLLSPVFDALAPGMGKAQFNAGNALFTLTNNTVEFSKIELLSSAMRIDMQGGVTFDGDLDMVLEARPLRGVPLLGAVLDFVLAPFTKLFEYEVKGTLGEPVAELKNVPTFLLAPLRPFKTLKSIFNGPELKPLPEGK